MPLDKSIIAYDKGQDRYKPSTVTLDDLTPDGEESVAQRFTGVWASNSEYLVDQFVTHDGKLWRSTIDNNNTTPGTNEDWEAELTFDFIPSSVDIKNIVKITQAAYDALATKVATTLYVIVG